MSKLTLRDDIRSKVEQRMHELAPLVQEYEELRRIAAAIEGELEPQPAPALAVPPRTPRRTGPRRRRSNGRAEQA
jgi:hypothetical protein